jgi:hypothetical protein
MIAQLFVARNDRQIFFYYYVLAVFLMNWLRNGVCLRRTGGAAERKSVQVIESAQMLFSFYLNRDSLPTF